MRSLSLVGCVLAIGCAFVAGADGGTRAAAPGLPWVLDGGVDALAVGDGKAFVAGSFERIAAPSGPLVAFRSSGARKASFPVVEVGGSVSVVVSDGAGGFYVGGSFRTVGGVACPLLAHVRRDGTVDRSFCPRPSGEEASVHALALSGSTLYVGGSFTRIAGAARSHLAALDLRAGGVTGWKPSFEPYVWQLAGNADAVYVLAGQTFVAFDAKSGRRLAFAPRPDANSHGDSVEGVVLAGARVYTWGHFSRIGGKARRGIAALDARSGKALKWSGPSLAFGAGLVVGKVVYLAGCFDSVNGQPRDGLAAFDAATGRLLPWQAKGLPCSLYGALAAADGVLYEVGGTGREAASKVIARSLRSGAAVRFAAPQLNGEAEALAASAGTVVVGGSFRSLAGLPHPGLFAFDATTLQPLPWQPRIRGESSDDPGVVDDLALIGSTLYISGFFSSVDGQPRKDAAAFDTTSGRLLNWQPPPSHVEFAASGRAVYTALASDFAPSGSWTLFAFDPHTGAPAGTCPLPTDISSLAASDDAIFVGDVIGEQFAVAAIDPSTLRLSAQISAEGVPGVQSLAADGRHVYAGGDFTGIGGVRQPWLARLTLAGGRLRVDPWRPRLPGPVDAVAVSGGQIVVGGTVSDSRWYVAIADAKKATVRVLGYGQHGDVSAVAASGRYVYVGGGFGLQMFGR